jgi:hypothetical protein
MIYWRIFRPHLYVKRWDTLPGAVYFNLTIVRRAV